jgi:hypothetical protein
MGCHELIPTSSHRTPNDFAVAIAALAGLLPHILHDISKCDSGMKMTSLLILSFRPTLSLGTRFLNGSRISKNAYDRISCMYYNIVSA